MRRTTCVRVAAVLGATALLVGLAWSSPLAAAQEHDKKPPVFVGYCEPGEDPAGGTCVLDEPEGQNPDTHGTVTYDREFADTTDSLTFVLPSVTDPTEVQVCLTVATDGVPNPYVPTHANTCAGNSSDRVYAQTDPPETIVVDVATALAGVPGYAPGVPLWFTVHVVAGGRTLAVTGASTPGTAPMRTVTITKDAVPDSSSPFSFTLDCMETTLSPANVSLASVSFAHGDATFVLGDGGTAVFTGIADGDECTVTETTTGWSTTAAGRAGSTAIVDLTGANAVVPFVNVQQHTLTITKSVASPTAAEKFTVSVDCGGFALGAANNPSVAVTYLDGDATVLLGDGGTFELTGIPHGTTCAVAETVVDTPGVTWLATVDGVAGTGRSILLTTDQTVAFVNTLMEVRPTVVTAQVLGVQIEAENLAKTGGLPIGLVATAAALFGLGMAFVVIGRRRPAGR